MEAAKGEQSLREVSMQGYLGKMYGDYKIHKDENLFSWAVARWCKSKKKRIRKKWKKMCFRTGRYLKRVPKLDGVYVMGNNIICHPLMYDKLIEAVEPHHKS